MASSAVELHYFVFPNSSDYTRRSLLTIYAAAFTAYTTCINIKESNLSSTKRKPSYVFLNTFYPRSAFMIRIL